MKTLLCLLLAVNAIFTSSIGLLNIDDEKKFVVDNIYGQTVELFGDGVYAYNSILTVSSRLGADWIGLFGGIFLIFLLFKDKEKLWVNTLMTAQIVMFSYFFASLAFSISMNRLYLLYVFGFGLSIFLSILYLATFFEDVEVKNNVKAIKHIGLRRCLAISGGAIIGIWLSMLVPYFISENYGELLGVLTTEATYAIDLGIIGPSMILCSFWMRKKYKKGYVLAPILLYILFSVGPMVILQNIYSILFGIKIPIAGFIILALSFIIMSGFAFVYLIKSVNLLRIKDKS